MTERALDDKATGDAQIFVSANDIVLRRLSSRNADQEYVTDLTYRLAGTDQALTNDR